MEPMIIVALLVAVFCGLAGLILGIASSCMTCGGLRGKGYTNGYTDGDTASQLRSPWGWGSENFRGGTLAYALAPQNIHRKKPEIGRKPA